MESLRATQMIGGNGESERRPTDLYPTPPDVTEALLRFLDIPSFFRVWDPAAGEGDMARQISAHGHTVYESDIMTGTDFLAADGPPNADLWLPCDWIITNPPFSISEQFIRHANELVHPFAMLLKSQYWHASKRLRLFREVRPDYVLPLTWRPNFYFKEEHGGAPLMDVMWCVWSAENGRKSHQPTIFKPLERPKMREENT